MDPHVEVGFLSVLREKGNKRIITSCGSNYDITSKYDSTLLESYLIYEIKLI